MTRSLNKRTMTKAPPPQLDLFGPPPSDPTATTPSGVRPVGVSPSLRSLATSLGTGAHLGTSSWSFPGWTGIVWGNEATQTALVRSGLNAYAQHPLLRTVGVDRTFYAPVSREVFADYAAGVPEDFRFLVKAHDACTLARFPGHARYGAHRGQPNPRFLDASYATDAVVQPFVEGLGRQAGPLVFQFPPQDPRALGGGKGFAEAVHTFASALPKGPLYAFEVRNRELMTAELQAALADVKAVPVMAVWGALPSVLVQAKALAAKGAPALVVRWMLPPNVEYEEARARFAPFDRLVNEQPRTRSEIAELCAAALQSGTPAFVTINNKAEGSAPLSVFKLAEEIRRHWTAGPSLLPETE